MAKDKPNILVIWGDDIGIAGRASFITGQSVYRTGLPPRQKAASFTIDQVVANLEAVITSGH